MDNKRKNVIFAIFSTILSCVGVFTILLFLPFLKKNVAAGLNIKILSVWNLLLFVILDLVFFVLLRVGDRVICRLELYDTGRMHSAHKVFWASFVVIIAFWSIWFWLYFPGAGMNDTINCIMSFHNNNQTLAYQLMIYYGIHGLTQLTHSMTVAYAILTLVQMVSMALIIAWITQWLSRKSIRKKLICLFVAYYAVMPVIADYSITLVKDTLYGVCVMAAIPLIYELISNSGNPIKNRKLYCVFLLDLIGIDLLRSNGKYIAIALVILLMLIKLKHKGYLLFVFVILIVINTGIDMGEKSIIREDAGFRESIGAPLAQIGAVLVTDGYMSEQDRETLNHLLPLEIWEENVRLSFADSIKFNSSFDNQWLNDNKKEFINAWFSVLKDNFDIYVKAYLCHTYGFWNISPLNVFFMDYTQSYFTEINNNTVDDSFWGEYCAANGLYNREIGQGTVDAALNLVLKLAFAANMALGAGIMLWTCVLFIIELVIYRKYKICSVFLPVILNWGTMMLAAPASLIYRYSFYLVLSLPVLFFIMLMQIKAEDNVLSV